MSNLFHEIALELERVKEIYDDWDIEKIVSEWEELNGKYVEIVDRIINYVETSTDNQKALGAPKHFLGFLSGLGWVRGGDLKEEIEEAESSLEPLEGLDLEDLKQDFVSALSSLMESFTRIETFIEPIDLGSQKISNNDPSDELKAASQDSINQVQKPDSRHESSDTPDQRRKGSAIAEQESANENKRAVAENTKESQESKNRMQDNVVTKKGRVQPIKEGDPPSVEKSSGVGKSRRQTKKKTSIRDGKELA